LQLALDAGFPTSALSSLSGTGPNGRIIAADVKEAIAEGRLGLGATAAAAAPAAQQPAVSAAAVSAQAAAAAPAGGAGAGSPVPSRAGYVDIPHTQMRRVIAQRLTMSKQTVPHYTLTSEITLDALLALRTQLNAELSSNSKDKDSGVKLSVNDFIIKASALACRKVPEMNSSWLEHGIRSYGYCDVSVAVALPDGQGLITPIVTDADTKGLATIARCVISNDI
jgi:pyruvate dehydrogenase E2 component (dihydrolipoamide acetyltransferase)